MWLAVRELRELYKVEHLAHARGLVGLAHPFVLEAVAHVLLHAHMREQGIALEHHVNRALPGGNARHVLPVEENAARAWFLEPREHPEKRRLAAARSAEKGEDLALLDRQVHVMDRLKRPEGFRDAFDPHEGVGHDVSLP